MRFKTQSILILALILFLIPTIAEGADLAYTGKAQGNVQYIDKESIRNTSKNTFRAWTKLDLGTPKLWESSGGSSKLIEQILAYQEFDCAEWKVRNIKLIHYYTDGSHDKFEGFNIWNYVIPDTLVDTVFQYLCKNGK